MPPRADAPDLPAGHGRPTHPACRRAPDPRTPRRGFRQGSAHGPADLAPTPRRRAVARRLPDQLSDQEKDERQDNLERPLPAGGGARDPSVEGRGLTAPTTGSRRGAHCVVSRLRCCAHRDSEIDPNRRFGRQHALDGRQLGLETFTGDGLGARPSASSNRISSCPSRGAAPPTSSDRRGRSACSHPWTGRLRSRSARHVRLANLRSLLSVVATLLIAAPLVVGRRLPRPVVLGTFPRCAKGWGPERSTLHRGLPSPRKFRYRSP